MESKGIRAKGLQVRILSPRPNNSVIWCDNPRHTATSLKQAFFPLPKNHRDIPRHSATLKKTPWRHPGFPSPLAAAFYLPKAPLRDDQIAAGAHFYMPGRDWYGEYAREIFKGSLPAPAPF